jgi:hypothetical protein
LCLFQFLKIPRLFLTGVTQVNPRARAASATARKLVAGGLVQEAGSLVGHETVVVSPVNTSAGRSSSGETCGNGSGEKLSRKLAASTPSRLALSAVLITFLCNRQLRLKVIKHVPRQRFYPLSPDVYKIRQELHFLCMVQMSLYDENAT